MGRDDSPTVTPPTWTEVHAKRWSESTRYPRKLKPSSGLLTLLNGGRRHR